MSIFKAQRYYAKKFNYEVGSVMPIDLIYEKLSAETDITPMGKVAFILKCYEREFESLDQFFA